MAKRWHPIVFLAAALLVAGTHAWLDQALDKQLDKKHISRKDWKVPVVDVPTYTLEFSHKDLARYVVNPNATGQQTQAANKVQSAGSDAGHDLLMGPAGIDEMAGPAGSRKLLTSSGPHIKYFGGDVIVGTPNVYMIYVNSKEASGSSDWSWTHWPNYLLRNLGDSYRYKINIRYFNKQRQHVNGKVNLAAAIHVTIPQDFPLDLGDATSWGGLGAVLQGVMQSGKVPVDADNGIYVVAVAPDSGLTLDGGYCNTYCGFHSEFVLPDNNSYLKFAFMAQASDQFCSQGCSIDQSQLDQLGVVSPTGSVYTDGLLSVLVHELEETVTDPLPDVAPGWLAKDHKDLEENADLCAWQFGKPHFTDVKGEKAIYNAVVGGVPVLVQMGWDRVTQKCVQGVINP